MRIRTLALAVSIDGVATESSLPANLQPVALVTFSERVRDDARDTLAYFHEQGVDIRIISGDNPATVAAVARRAGLDIGEAIDARTPLVVEAGTGVGKTYAMLQEANHAVARIMRVARELGARMPTTPPCQLGS